MISMDEKIVDRFDRLTARLEAVGACWLPTSISGVRKLNAIFDHAGLIHDVCQGEDDGATLDNAESIIVKLEGMDFDLSDVELGGEG